MSSWEWQFGFKNRKEIVFPLPKQAEDLLRPCPSLGAHNPHFSETGNTKWEHLTWNHWILYSHKGPLWKQSMQELNIDRISSKIPLLITWIKKSRASCILSRHTDTELHSSHTTFCEQFLYYRSSCVCRSESMCTTCVQMPLEASRGHQMSWNWCKFW